VSSERKPRFGPSPGSGSSTLGGAPTTADARRTPRRGTSSAGALNKRMHSGVCTSNRTSSRGRVLRSVLRPVHVNPHYAPRRKLRRWGVRSGITVGQTWGNSGRTSTGATADGRSAARRRSPHAQAWQRGRKEKEGDHGLPPCEARESRFGCPHVEVQLQKSIGDVWSRIRSANALQKERQGRVNRDLARSGGRWVKPSAGASRETKSRGPASPLKTGEDRHETQDASRLASSGRHIAKSGAAVVEPGP
jgi:hypothetical protein